MERSEEFEVDPALAETMGFSGFGSQINKKRKFNKGDGFVADISKDSFHTAATGANATSQGEQKNAKAPHQAVVDDQAGTANSEGETDEAGKITFTLEELRHGVCDEQGDMVYFLPSFIEDPWNELQAQ